LLQLKKGFISLYWILSVTIESLLREYGVESTLSLLGENYPYVSDFFFAVASVEHLLMTIFDFGRS
jgi:hypothetical protein